MIKTLHREGARCVHTGQLRKHTRQRLVQANYLVEVIKGWYVIHLDHFRDFTESDWHVAYEPFIAFYCNRFFGGEWHLSQEQSLLRHIGAFDKPQRTVVHAPLANNKTRPLLFGDELQTICTTFSTNGFGVPTRNGLYTMPLAHAIIRVPPQWISCNETAYRSALARIDDIGQLIEPLLDKNQTQIAGRIHYALKALGRQTEASALQEAVRAAGLRLRITNPFRKQPEP